MFKTGTSTETESRLVARVWGRGCKMGRWSQALRQLLVRHTEAGVSTGCHQRGDIIRTS